MTKIDAADVGRLIVVAPPIAVRQRAVDVQVSNGRLRRRNREVAQAGIANRQRYRADAQAWPGTS